MCVIIYNVHNNSNYLFYKIKSGMFIAMLFKDKSVMWSGSRQK